MTTPYVPNDGVTTTTTTTEEPTVSTSESTEGTTESTEGTTESTEGTTEAASEKLAPSVSTTEEGSGLPFTGEATGTVLVLAGVVILSGTVVMKRKFSK